MAQIIRRLTGHGCAPRRETNHPGLPVKFGFADPDDLLNQSIHQNRILQVNVGEKSEVLLMLTARTLRAIKASPPLNNPISLKM